MALLQRACSVPVVVHPQSICVAFGGRIVNVLPTSIVQWRRGGAQRVEEELGALRTLRRRLEDEQQRWRQVRGGERVEMPFPLVELLGAPTRSSGRRRLGFGSLTPQRPSWSLEMVEWQRRAYTEHGELCVKMCLASFNSNAFEQGVFRGTLESDNV